jgi:hypothetical protein
LARQVGNTTLLLKIASQSGEAAIYAGDDEPDAVLLCFWERRWADAEARAQRGTFLLLDEIIICPTGPKRFFPRGLLARPKAHSDIGIRGTFPWHRRTRMAIGHDLTFARQSLQKLPFEMHSGPPR